MYIYYKPINIVEMLLSIQAKPIGRHEQLFPFRLCLMHAPAHKQNILGTATPKGPRYSYAGYFPKA